MPPGSGICPQGWWEEKSFTFPSFPCAGECAISFWQNRTGGSRAVFCMLFRLHTQNHHVCAPGLISPSLQSFLLLLTSVRIEHHLCSPKVVPHGACRRKGVCRSYCTSSRSPFGLRSVAKNSMREQEKGNACSFALALRNLNQTNMLTSASLC